MHGGAPAEVEISKYRFLRVSSRGLHWESKVHKLKRIISLFRKVASLAQLLLDPYFRTVSGFQVFSFYESVSLLN